MFRFTPLLGAQSASKASQSLLELGGGIKILIDLGWDESFDVEDLKAIERHTRSLSIILITHATASHLAAFAHCCKHIPFFTQIPVYATSPVISLGRTLLQDIYSSTPLASTVIPRHAVNSTSISSRNGNHNDPRILLQPPSLEEIASYFASIHPLKFSQPHQPLPSPFSPPLNELTITAYNAGHSLGGTIWHIQHGMESIVYAVDWNQLKENVYSGAAWLRGTGGTEVIGQLRKPTALVCSAKGAKKMPLAGGRAKRDSMLIEMIRNCVEKGGTVLIPTDTSARALELAYVLEHAWRKEALNPGQPSSLASVKLYMASRTFGATMRYASSMLEWMEDNVVREFETDSNNTGKQYQHRRGNSKQPPNQSMPQGGVNSSGPFEFRFLKSLQSRKRVEKVLAGQGPRVILASDASLKWGFSKDILESIATDPKNLIILTEDYGSSLAFSDSKAGPLEVLWQCYQSGKESMIEEIAPDGSILESAAAGGKELHFTDAGRAPLEGKDLSVYQLFLSNKQQAEQYSQMESRTALETSADAVDEASSSSSSDDESDPERQGKALNSTFKAARFNKAKTEPSKEALGVNVLLRYRGVYDYDVRGKKGRDQMFPTIIKRRRTDDFGELIKPEDYLRAEEKDDVDARDLRDDSRSRKESLGQKRKWQETHIQGEDEAISSVVFKKRGQQNPKGPDKLVNGDERSKINVLDQMGESSAESDPEHEENATGPSRLELRTKSVDARLRIAFIDFAGIHDQRSLSMLIPLIKPKKLVLTGGTASETTHLAGECKQKLNADTTSESGGEANSIFTPDVGQLVDASVDTNAWTIKLSDALSKQIHWQNVRGLGVVTLAGQLAATLSESEAGPESHLRKKMKLEENTFDSDVSTEKPIQKTNTDTDDAPTLDVLPPNTVAASISLAQPLHVGDLRLADLRKILQSIGHTAEFRGEGTLLIDKLVAVRKSSTGKIELESGGLSLSDTRANTSDGSFYAVKRKIYDGLAVIAAG